MLSLTARRVADLRLPSAGQQVDYYDTLTRGFVLRVQGPSERSPKGRKVWCAFVRVRGDSKRQRITIGPWPVFSIEAARDLAHEMLQAARKGVDPAPAYRMQRAALRTVKPTRATIERVPVSVGLLKQIGTMGELIEEYCRVYAPTKRSGHDDVRALNRECLGVHHRTGESVKGFDPANDWRDLLVERDLHVIRRDAVLVLDRISARGSAGMRDRMIAYLSRLGSFARERGAVPWASNPFDRLPRDKKRKRDKGHAMTDGEIKLLWTALEDAPVSANLRRALRFMLVTGQRPNEVRGLREGAIHRSGVTDDNGRQFPHPTWRIEAGDYKTGDTTGHGNAVPLTPLAMELIGPRRAKADSLIFPSEETGEAFNEDAFRTAIERLFRSKGKKDTRQPPLAGMMPRVTPKDFRTTAFSTMRRLGISRDDCDRVVGHVIEGIAKHYDLYGMLPEQWHALTTLADHVAGLLPAPPPNVVKLARPGI